MMSSNETAWATFTDLHGERLDVEAALHAYDGRIVYLDNYGFTPQTARDIAKALTEAANAIENSLIGIPGGSRGGNEPGTD